MKIATWNVNGIRARHEQVRAWIQEHSPDIICLQEIKALAAQVPASLADLGDYRAFWHGGKGGYSGVALLVRKGFWAEPVNFAHPIFDVENRVVAAKIGNVTVASIYVPNGGKDFPAKIRFLEEMGAYARDFAEAGELLVLAGDLNVAHTDRDVHPKERRPVTGQLPGERGLFDRILGHGLVDVGRAMDPDNEGLFTWWAPWRNMRARNIGWRLDYLLASTTLAGKAHSCGVHADVGTSDHAPVMATFQA